MTGELFLREMLRRYEVSWGSESALDIIETKAVPYIERWGGRAIAGLEYLGSQAKGTAIRGGTDVDLLISLRDDVSYAVSDLYFHLFQFLGWEGFVTRTQNVSIGVRVDGLRVDLIPAKREGPVGNDHRLYRWKPNTWIRTNVHEHVRLVWESGRTEEIRLIKLWRTIHGLEFPSFYLELVVIDGLKGRPVGKLEKNILTVFEFLAEEFPFRMIVDPTNMDNVVSDDLDPASRFAIARAAQLSRQTLTWEEIYCDMNLV
jgi:hypothetical protein